MTLSRTALFTSPASVCEALASLVRGTVDAASAPIPASSVRRAVRRRRRSRNRLRRP